jgi:nuclear pore complex protein Nup210
LTRDSGDVLKCESRVADIKRVEILTKLRVIDTDNYEVFELIAYDRMGNSFSSLEGVRFDWSIEQPSALASFVSFKDASIKTTETRMQIEAMGFRSDMAVMTGINPGTVTVTAFVNEKEMKVGCLLK